jgi:MFS family permease
MILNNIPSDANLIAALRTIFYIAAIGSGLSGSLLSEKIRRENILYVWMVLGVVSSFLLSFFYSMPVAYVSIIFLLLGISFGLGMPASLAYLADYTEVENRGRISSVIFVATNLVTLPLAILFMGLNLETNSTILTAWRGMGLLIFILLKPRVTKSVETKEKVSFSSIIHNRSFGLYLLPWIMFSLIDSLEKALLGDFIGPDFLSLILTIEPIIASFFMLIGGLLADRIGRKRVVIYGFISLGVAYAIVGMAPAMTLSWYFYIAIDGIATGILWIIFLLILWGDLSQFGLREKYYVIGSVPFLARNIIPVMLIPFLTLVPANAAFSLASFFLFLAVLPLMYAPETLPEKKMEIRRLKGYVEQAKKLVEKTHKEY